MSQLYFIRTGTEVLVIGDTAPWAAKDFRLTETKMENVFTDAEVIMNPITRECTHYAPNAQTLGKGWAQAGHFGFKRSGYCLIVESANVRIHPRSAAA
ncbi:MAG: hypothetical protein LLG06_04070 [Desulfobacteraceae bacterium]|nr:hypothetical protein [Desulfobacteraceae bacterium]